MYVTSVPSKINGRRLNRTVYVPWATVKLYCVQTSVGLLACLDDWSSEMTQIRLLEE